MQTRGQGAAPRVRIDVPAIPAPPIKSRLQPGDDAKQIESFVVTECENHFSLYALTDNRTFAAIYSMVLTLEPPYHVETWGQLVIRACNYVEPKPDPDPENEGTFYVELRRSATSLFEFKVFKVLLPVALLHPMTIGELTSFLVARNMHEYVFTSEMLGCRYFTIAVLSELALAGYVPEGSGEKLQELAEKRLETETEVGLFPSFKRP